VQLYLGIFLYKLLPISTNIMSRKYNKGFASSGIRWWWVAGGDEVSLTLTMERIYGKKRHKNLIFYLFVRA